MVILGDAVVVSEITFTQIPHLPIPDLNVSRLNRNSALRLGKQKLEPSLDYSSYKLQPI